MTVFPLYEVEMSSSQLICQPLAGKGYPLAFLNPPTHVEAKGQEVRRQPRKLPPLGLKTRSAMSERALPSALHQTDTKSIKNLPF